MMSNTLDDDNNTLPTNLFAFLRYFLKSHKKYFGIYCFMSLLAGLSNPFNILLISKTISLLAIKNTNVKIIAYYCFLIVINFIVFDNICYANLEARVEEVYQASQNASIHDFIIGLPDGYNTIVGDRGITLSRGQKQRISLSRAFLKNSKILIFDESTSALDSITEKNIQFNLQSLIEKKTTIIIAHRLSTISHIDQILVFHDGSLVARGSHDYLIKNNILYQELYNNQRKKE